MREREQRGSQIKQTPLIPYGDAAASSSSVSLSPQQKGAYAEYR